jgi:hypothetical protein
MLPTTDGAPRISLPEFAIAYLRAAGLKAPVMLPEVSRGGRYQAPSDLSFRSATRGRETQPQRIAKRRLRKWRPL